MNLFSLDNLILLLTGLVALYLVWRFYRRYSAQKKLHDIYYMLGFVVLLVSGLLLIFLGYGILASPYVLTVATLIPLGISLGIMNQYFRKWKKVYAWFALRWLQQTRVGCAPEPLARALAWLDERTGPEGSTSGDDGNRVPVATAWTALCRLLDGRDPDRDPRLAAQVDWLLAHPSSIQLGDPLLDSEYVCLGAHVLFQVGGEAWKTWNETMKIQLLQVQQRSGAEAGSWDPADVGPTDRTSVTALRALTFEVYYRFAKLER